MVIKTLFCFLKRKYLNQTSSISKKKLNAHTVSLDENFFDNLNDTFTGELSLYSRQALYSANDDLSNY